jgi:hypothetical protein
MHACLHAYMRAHVIHADMLACRFAYMLACRFAYMLACRFAYMFACRFACKLSCRLAYLIAYRFACMHAFTNSSMPGQGGQWEEIPPREEGSVGSDL